MIEEVAENIYRIEVRMPGNPLKALNSYFIRGDEQDLLIDTGFKLPECREDLKEGLKKLNSHQQRRNILLTMCIQILREPLCWQKTCLRP